MPLSKAEMYAPIQVVLAVPIVLLRIYFYSVRTPEPIIRVGFNFYLFKQRNRADILTLLGQVLLGGHKFKHSLRPHLFKTYLNPPAVG